MRGFTETSMGVLPVSRGRMMTTVMAMMIMRESWMLLIIACLFNQLAREQLIDK